MAWDVCCEFVAGVFRDGEKATTVAVVDMESVDVKSSVGVGVLNKH